MTAALRLEMPDLAVDIFEDSFGFCFDTDPAKGETVKTYLITVLVGSYLFFIPRYFNLISLSLTFCPLHSLIFSHPFQFVHSSHIVCDLILLSSHFQILTPTTPPLPHISSY